MHRCIAFLIVLSICFAGAGFSQQPGSWDKIEGMLIGSVLGDAAGGPVEFVHPPDRCIWCSADTILTESGINELALRFRLRDYPKQAEPYAQWESYGPPGTVTDDTRFKIIFFNALKQYGKDLTRNNFAQSVLDFRDVLKENYKPWYDRWIPEIEYGTRWVLGERENAFPPERIWGSIPTMAGQMPFIAAAVLNPYEPEWVYRKVWDLDYLDVGIAKDMTAALAAGLARALQSDGTWQTMEKTMRETDPYGFNRVPWVPRRLNEYLDLSHELVVRSEGRISRLFSLFESELKSRTWWEAWVPVVVVFSCAEIVEYNPLASMQIIMEFGHDTDSYAQVMGAIVGAIHGKTVFAESMRRQVNDRMKEQFGVNVYDWLDLLNRIER